MRAHRPSDIVTFPRLWVNWVMNRVSSPGAPCIDRLQVLIQSHSITASKCISKLGQSRPPIVTPNSLDYGRQVRTNMPSKCISQLARSRSRSASLCSLNHGLQVYLQIRSFTASKCLSKLTRSRPWSISLSLLDCHFQVHFQLLSSTACSQSRYRVCRWVAI